MVHKIQDLLLVDGRSLKVANIGYDLKAFFVF